MATAVKNQRNRASYTYAAYHVDGTAALAPALHNGAHKSRKAVYPVRKRISLRRQAPLILLLTVGLFILGFVVLGQFSRCTKQAKQISQLRYQLANVEKDNEVLRKDVSALENGGRIQSYAINQMGMVKFDEANAIKVHMPNPRPPTNAELYVPPSRTGWLNFLLGLLD